MFRGSQMSKRIALLAAAVLMCATWSSAQTRIDQTYDTQKPTTLTGEVRGTYRGDGGLAYILLEVRGKDGTRQQWAIQGGPARKLMEETGLKLDTGGPPPHFVTLGEVISALVYPAKVKVELDPERNPGRVYEQAIAGRLVYGVEITRADGKTVKFGGSAP
jgi:hypothetical protein